MPFYEETCLLLVLTHCCVKDCHQPMAYLRFLLGYPPFWWFSLRFFSNLLGVRVGWFSTAYLLLTVKSHPWKFSLFCELLYMLVPQANRGNTAAIQQIPQFKPVPVYKWSITFHGDTAKASLSSFLQRVEELWVARNCKKKTYIIQQVIYLWVSLRNGTVSRQYT